ncbi:Pyrophosphate-energised proton pump [Sesbania bispinosa]|nr:Pyrophosphate-energised proton pump [Sesbania bispinosa]
MLKEGVMQEYITFVSVLSALRSGAIMGFLLAAYGLLVLYIRSTCLRCTIYGDDWGGPFEAITGYGLGRSSMALFGRVGEGIYTNVADVGANLVGKVEGNILEDDPRNPAVIADNVDDTVWDIVSTIIGFMGPISAIGAILAGIDGLDHAMTLACRVC